MPKSNCIRGDKGRYDVFEYNVGLLFAKASLAIDLFTMTQFQNRHSRPATVIFLPSQQSVL